MVAAASALAAACGGSSDGGLPFNGGCGVAQERQLVLDSARRFYLFLELLPQNVDPNQFATADELLNALTATARAEQKDRFFSHLTSVSAEQQFFSDAQSVGFGFSLKTSATEPRLFVSQVFETSAADDAGFARGDEILAIGTSESTLVGVPTILAQPNGLADAIGPTTSGVSRAFRVRLQDGSEALRTMAKRTFPLDPVPLVRIIARSGLTPVGYVNFRSFVSPAEAVLRDAFAQFRAQNVRDVIIDLRYNGGGLVATAEVLGSLLAQQAGATGALMHRTQFNANRPSIDVAFRAEPQALEPVSIVFLTTASTASASELVINSLSPYANTAIVGTRSFGKPVGQEAFDLTGCDTRLRLVTFKSVNRDGFGDYFTGLHPDSGFADAFCDAADDLTAPQGDEAEDMTAVALSWIENQACPVTTPKQGERRALALEAAMAFPPGRPTPAQIYQPGMH